MVGQQQRSHASLSGYLFIALSPVFAQLIRTHLWRGGGGTALSINVHLGSRREFFTISKLGLAPWVGTQINYVWTRANIT